MQGNKAAPATPAAIAPFSSTPAEIAPRGMFNPQDLWPRTLQEAMELSNFLAKSKMVPTHLQGQPENVFYTVLAGLELRVSPIVACREIYFVDGKPSTSSLLKVALVRERKEVCIKWEEIVSTPEKATYATRRVGDTKDTVRTFTIEEARNAGLLGKNNWKNWPAAMLRRRAQGALADDVYPDIVRGLGSADDDIPVDEKEVRTLERVAPPIPDGVAPSSNSASETVVNGTTGEIEKEPDSFEVLRVALSNANTDEEFAAIIERITNAKLNGKERDELRELFKTRKAEVAKAKAAEAKQ